MSAAGTGPHRKRPALTIAVVTFRPDSAVIAATLMSLGRAVAALGPTRTQLFIIDNTPQETPREWLRATPPELACEVISGHGNIGYGRANNLVTERTGDFHLVLNPDVEMAPEALSQAMAFMTEHPDCGLITPAAFGSDGRRQYLCKRYPRLVDLALRGFAPGPVRRLFRRRLDRYEMRDRTGEAVFWDPPLVSGCFMFFRGTVFRALNGFDPRYMLYFEDFDLSLRMGAVSRIAYVPDARIVHNGGSAAKKGFWHIQQFVRSATTFFSEHGYNSFR